MTYEGTYSVPSYTIRHHGFCEYCDKEIISEPTDFVTCFSLKMKTGEVLKWHTDCYTEALAKALMAQHK